jgi:glycosyltransferase involved in cell wall biosynthesis
MQDRLRVGYDAHAFVTVNKGSGKGLQLRNLLGRRISDFIGFAPPGRLPSETPLIREGSPRYLLWQQRDLPRQIRRAHLDIFLAPYNTAPLILPNQTRLILVLHDLIPFEPFSTSDKKLRLILAWWRLLIRRSVQRAALILTVSEYSRNKILEQFPNARTEVIHCTIPRSWYAESQMVPIQNRQNYFCLITSTEPHRNVDRFLSAYYGYVARARDEAVHMRIAGVWHQRDLVARKVRDLGLNAQVTIEPYLSDNEMQQMVRNARAVCLPSLSEGFGIPILEGMSVGTPVICSNVASMPEVGGDAPEYFDPFSVENICKALENVFSSVERQAAMSCAGLKRAILFHPDRIDEKIDIFWNLIFTQRV